MIGFIRLTKGNGTKRDVVINISNIEVIYKNPDGTAFISFSTENNELSTLETFDDVIEKISRVALIEKEAKK